MRLKEIETRLAEIKEELNTRAAELTDEEITKLETEVTDLQEERTALLAAAEKRKKLLERIAAGEPTGGAGADTTLLRNFKGAGGAGAGEPEDKYDTTAYRKAFMNYVCRGVAIPAEYRAAETTTTADSGAVIPTTIMNEIIQKLESYGSIYAKVRKINVQGGVSIPIADLKPTAHWITEAKSSDDQKASAKNSVTFNYYGLECKISQSILANVVTLKMFTDLFVPMATEAMVKAIEIAIFNGTGEGQPLGVLKDSRVTAVIRLLVDDVTKTDARALLNVNKMATISDIVAPSNEYIYASGANELTVVEGCVIAVGGAGIFKTANTILTAANLDAGSAFAVGKDYYVYICDSRIDSADEKYVISLNSTYPTGWNATNSRKIGGFHYGRCRKVDSNLQPLNGSSVIFGTGWESAVSNGIVPRSVWTLGHRPKCSPEGMVYLGGGTWVDIYLNSDDGAKTECLISYSQSGCPAVRQREKIRLLVSSYGERQELNT